MRKRKPWWCEGRDLSQFILVRKEKLSLANIMLLSTVYKYNRYYIYNPDVFGILIS